MYFIDTSGSHFIYLFVHVYSNSTGTLWKTLTQDTCSNRVSYLLREPYMNQDKNINSFCKYFSKMERKWLFNFDCRLLVFFFFLTTSIAFHDIDIDDLVQKPSIEIKKCEGNLAETSVIPLIARVWLGWSGWLGRCPLPPSSLHVRPSWSCALGERGWPSQIEEVYQSSVKDIGIKK